MQPTIVFAQTVAVVLAVLCVPMAVLAGLFIREEVRHALAVRGLLERRAAHSARYALATARTATWWRSGGWRFM